MEDLGINKLVGAVLATALGFLGLKEISHLAFSHSGPAAPAYALEIPDVATGPTDAIELPFPSADWVAAMDATKGAKVFKKCTSCHNAENGGANGTGPNLWAILGNSAAQATGFKYSSALTSAGITWDYESLDGFLKRPSKYLKGTNMNFIGLKKESDRAAVIAYLRQQAGTAIALPTVATADVMPKDAMSEKDALTDDPMIEKTPEAKDEH